MKKYGIWDNLHNNWFVFGIGKENSEEISENYDFFDTKKEAEDALAFCKLIFFNRQHEFVVREKGDDMPDSGLQSKGDGKM